MNPYETSQPQTPQIKKPKPLQIVKKVLFFIFIVVFFQGCTKLNSGIPIDETTTFAQMREVSTFHGLFVLPLAKVIIWGTKNTGSVLFGIFVATLVSRGIGLSITFKSNVEMEKVKEIQPHVQRIQAKYAGRTDTPSKMQMQAEMQKIYQKHGVSPLGGLASMFVAMPFFMGLWTAVRYNTYISDKILLGLSSTITTSQAIMKNFNFKVAFFVAAMLFLNWLQMKVPAWLSSERSKTNVKTKETDMQRNMTIFMPVLMFVITWNLSIAILVYFTISPLFAILQSVLLHQYIVKTQAKKEKSVNTLY